MTGIHSALTASIPDLRPEVSFLPQPLLTIHLSQEREEEGGSEDIVTEVDNVLGKLMASLQKGEYCCSRCGGHCHCWLLLLLSWLCLRYTTIWSTCWPRCRKLTPRRMLSLYSCPSAYSNTHGQGARRPEWPRRNLHICPIKSSRAKDNGRYPQQNGWIMKSKAVWKIS